MILTISINVDKLISEVGKKYYFFIENITASNIEWTNNGSGTVTDLEITVDNNTLETVTNFSLGYSASLVNSQNAQLYEDDNGNVVIDDHIITMTGNIDLDNSNVLYMVQKGILKIQNVNNNNLIFCYSLDSERNVVNKTLYLVDIINGYFRNGVNIKNPVITIQDYKLKNTFNYVYIYALNRYYFVQNIEVTTKNMTALALAEDVLMSHKDLILEQYGLISRNENDFNSYLPDNRRAYYDKPIIEYTEYDTGEYFNNVDVAGTSNDPVCYVLEVVRGD